MTSTVIASLVVMLWAVGPAVISAAANTPVCTGYHQWNDGTNCNACTSRGCPIGMFRETCTSASRQDARSVTASAVWRIPNGLFFCLRGSWMMLSHSRPRKKTGASHAACLLPTGSMSLVAFPTCRTVACGPAGRGTTARMTSVGRVSRTNARSQVSLACGRNIGDCAFSERDKPLTVDLWVLFGIPHG